MTAASAGGRYSEALSEESQLQKEVSQPEKSRCYGQIAIPLLQRSEVALLSVSQRQTSSLTLIAFVSFASSHRSMYLTSSNTVSSSTWIASGASAQSKYFRIVASSPHLPPNCTRKNRPSHCLFLASSASHTM